MVIQTKVLYLQYQITNNKQQTRKIMSPKQFDEKFKANHSKVEAFFGKKVDYLKGFFVTNPDRGTESFMYVIAPVYAIQRYYEMVTDAYHEFEKGPRTLTRRFVQVKANGFATKLLFESGKAFRTQPQAVKWMEGLQ